MKTLKNFFALLTLALLFNTAAFAQLSAGGGIAGADKFSEAVQTCTTAANFTKGMEAKVAVLQTCLQTHTKSTIDLRYYKGLAGGMVISGMSKGNPQKGIDATEVEWTYKGGGVDATEVEWTYKGGIDATEVEWTYDGGADLLKLQRIGK